MGIFKSINFWVSLVNILLSVLVLAGATIPADTGENLIKNLLDGNLWAFGAAITINVAVPVYKLIKNKAGTWRASLYSTNFWGQIITLVLYVLTFFGVSAPAGASDELIQALWSHDIGRILTALVVNLIVPIIHTFGVKVLPRSNLEGEGA